MRPWNLPKLTHQLGPSPRPPDVRMAALSPPGVSDAPIQSVMPRLTMLGTPDRLTRSQYVMTRRRSVLGM